MPRFITVHLQCDWEDCDTVGVEGEETVAPMTVTLNGGAPKEFLICKPHRDTVEEVLLPLMQKGVRVEKAPKRRRSASSSGGGSSTANGSSDENGDTVDHLECQEPGCGRDDIKNRAGMAQHVIRAHGYESLDAYEVRYHVHID